MQLHLTVAHLSQSTAAAGPVDVVADVPDGTTAADLGAAITAHLGVDGAARLCTGGMPLLPEHPVGRPPLVDGAAVTLVPRGARGEEATDVARRPTPAPVQLAVVHGPDAGRSYDLTRGVHVVGRSSDADLCLADHRLSRRHLEVRYGESGVLVRDLASTNGTRLDEVSLSDAPLVCRPGQRLALGGTVLELRTSADLPIASVTRPDGTRAVNRRPRVRVTPPTVEVALPRRPTPPTPARVPWIAVLLPLPVAAGMAVLLGPVMLTFALMGPLLMIGTAVNDRWLGARRYAAELGEYEADLGAARGWVDAAVRDELTRLQHVHPDPAAVLATAQAPGPRLWERRPCDDDALVVAVGRGRRPASVRVTTDGTSAAEVAHLREAPCTVALGQDGPLGMAGPEPDVTAVARYVVGQLAVLHSPHDLRFCVLTAEPESLSGWQWMARLPHVRDPAGRLRLGTAAAGPGAVADAVTELVALIEGRASLGTLRARDLSTVVVILDGAAGLRGVTGLATLLEEGPAAGVHTIALDSDTGRLPAEVASVLDLAAASPTLTVAGTPYDALTVDGVGAWWADRLSRALAPLRDATAGTDGGALPAAVSWSELCPRPPVDAGAVAARWQARPSSTEVPVGRDEAGTTHLDLVHQGPHFLVAGTTGAGKSELLRTLVISLAVHNDPAHLSVLLVDYKGGAAFRECAHLPHTTGVVTDLDDRLAARALASLRAELRHREATLASAGVADFEAYHRDGAPGQLLPRLVIVIDEFRALAEDLPEFVTGLVRVAALGRSLGIHLVLATQRPAGVVTADIKANINGRIALRVRDRGDSDDVIESPLAATLDSSTPGRAYLRTGGEGLRAFQTALVTASTSGSTSTEAASHRVRVTPVPWGRPPDQEPEGSGGAGLRALVAAVSEAARCTAAQSPARAWLPPLPDRLPRDGLRHHDGHLSVAIGLVDHPEEQSQPPLELDLRLPGHWAFVGSAGSGRTTALLTACTAVAHRLGPAEAHLYAVSGGGLAQLEDLPHCGAHVDRSDRERLRRLVGRLGAEVERRRRLLTRSGFATLADWRAAGATSGSLLFPPPLVLAVDDWDQLTLGGEEPGDLVDDVVRLLREGGPVGLRAVLAGGRSLLHGAITSLVAHRVVLRVTDTTDAALAGLPASWVRTGTPPGRGRLADGREVQVALPHGSGSLPLASDTGSDGDLPFPVAELPPRVRETDLRPATGATALGIGGDDATTISLDPARHGRRWLFTGPPASGVSTALLVAARGLMRQRHPLAVVSTRPGPLDVLRHDDRLAAWWGADDAVDRLVDVWGRHPDLCLVVDGADGLLDHPVEAVLREVAARVDRPGGLVVAGASSTALASQFRGFAVELSRHRTGVLLGGGGPGAGDVFGLRLPRDGAAPPGRALLVTRDGVVPFQVAEPDVEPARSAS